MLDLRAAVFEELGRPDIIAFEERQRRRALPVVRDFYRQIALYTRVVSSRPA